MNEGERRAGNGIRKKETEEDRVLRRGASVEEKGEETYWYTAKQKH